MDRTELLYLANLARLLIQAIDAGIDQRFSTDQVEIAVRNHAVFELLERDVQLKERLQSFDIDVRQKLEAHLDEFGSGYFGDADVGIRNEGLCLVLYICLEVLQSTL